MRWIYEFPRKLNIFLKRRDLRTHRIDRTFLHRVLHFPPYSRLALWLPLPVLFVLAHGMVGFSGRGGKLLFWYLALAVVYLALYWLARGRLAYWLPTLQWLVLTALALGTFIAASEGAHQADPQPYRHIYAWFGVIVLFFGMAISRPFAEWLIGRQRKDFRAGFAPHFHSTRLLECHPYPAGRPLRVVRAFLLAPIGSPLLLVVLPALAVLIAPAGSEKLFGFVGLGFSWAFLAVCHYNDQMRSSQELLRQAFLVGGPSVVTLIIVILAAARLAGIDYVTTVLDQASWTIILGLALIFYLIFWLYDYWTQRALAEVLLGLLTTDTETHPHEIDHRQNAHLQIHGAGRFMAIRPAGQDWHFEGYRPLEVFERIHERLEWTATTQAEHQAADDLADLLDVLKEKVQIYRAIPAILLLLVVYLGNAYAQGADQQPGLAAANPTAAQEKQLVDLGARLKKAGPDQTLYAVAASGGGTRAALWSYSVLHALHKQQLLDRVVLLSSVSGGSAGVAYFGAHRKELLARSGEAPSEGQPCSRAATPPWQEFRRDMARPYIGEVLAGVGEWRFLRGARLGFLLSEGFDRHFYDDGNGDACRTLKCLKTEDGGIGVLINTAVTGSSIHDADEVDRDPWSGSRLVVSNLRGFSRESAASRAEAHGWPLDQRFTVLRDPEAELTKAASLSANFPPVFSDAKIVVGRGQDSPPIYWVTDGGAVDNRGLISLLLALRAELRALVGDLKLPCPPYWLGSGDTTANCDLEGEPPVIGLPNLKILVAEASAVDKPSAGPYVHEDSRGLKAATSSSTKLASKLLAELTREVATGWRTLSGDKATLEVIYFPMPTLIRSSFGTHWQMPWRVELGRPLGAGADSAKRGPIELDQDELECVVDLLLAPDSEREDLKLDPSTDTTDLWDWVGKDPDRDPFEVLCEAIPEGAECGSG